MIDYTEVQKKQLHKFLRNSALALRNFSQRMIGVIPRILVPIQVHAILIKSLLKTLLGPMDSMMSILEAINVLLLQKMCPVKRCHVATPE